MTTIELTHEQKIEWMAVWAARNGLQLILEGECGFGRECVGVSVEGHYPDYTWDNEDYERIDPNGDVWTPPNAYHKHDCVAVLGRGEQAEAELYEWLQWFDENGFKLETGDNPIDPNLPIAITLAMGKHRYVRMVKREKGEV
jgi:hypothetical protein